MTSTVDRASVDDAAAHVPQDGGQLRRHVSLPVVLLLGSLMYGTVRQGGFYPWQFATFAGAMALAGGFAIVESRAGWIQSCRSVAPFTGVVVASALVTGGWNSSASGWVAGAACAVIGWQIAANASASDRRVLWLGVQLVGAAIAATAITGVLVHRAPWARLIAGVWRGEATLTYANAAAAVLLVLIFPTIIEARTSLASRAFAFVFALGLVSTGNRSAWLLAVIGVGLHLFRSTEWRQLFDSWLALALGVGLPAITLLLRAPADPSIPLLLAVASLPTGLALGNWAFSRSLGGRSAAILVLALSLLTLVPGVRSGLQPMVANRLDLESVGTRFEEWGAALQVWSDHPFLGAGPGRALLSFDRDGEPFVALFAHNEYLQVAAEMGAFGLAGLGWLLAWAWRQMRLGPRDGLAPSMRLAVGLAVAHSALDFLWHLPLLVVVVAVVAGLTTLERKHMS